MGKIDGGGEPRKRRSGEAKKAKPAAKTPFIHLPTGAKGWEPYGELPDLCEVQYVPWLDGGRAGGGGRSKQVHRDGGVGGG